MPTFGTCLGCDKVRQLVRENRTVMVKGRREGWCAQCLPKTKPRLMVNYKQKEKKK